MDISFDCGNCGKHLVVDEAGAGNTIECPGCLKPVYVPSPSSQNQSAPPTRVEVKSATPKAAPDSAPKASSSSSERRTGWSPPSLVVKYTTLRTIANVCQFMAVPVAILHVLLAFLVYNLLAPLLVPPYGPFAIIPAVAAVVAGVIAMVSMFAGAESIRVFIDIEENTRATRQMMEYELQYKYGTAAPAAKPP